MGNQLIKGYDTGNTENPRMIKKTNNVNDLSYTSSYNFEKVTDMTLRNTIWSFIDNQEDYDIMEDLIVGKITPDRNIDTYIATQDAQEKGTFVRDSNNMITLPIYQSADYPTPDKKRTPDPASAHNIYPNNNTPVLVNRVKAICHQQYEAGLTEKNVVSYTLPKINGNFANDNKTNTCAENCLDENTILNYPINLSKIIEQKDKDPTATLKQLQDLADKFHILKTLSITSTKEKTADQLISELQRKSYPKLLDIESIGYMIDQNSDDYTKLKTIMANNITKSSNDSSGVNSGCDTFMIHQCAKQVYEQGCLKYDVVYDKDGKPLKQVPTWSPNNDMCYDETNIPFYGVNECACLNNPYGNALGIKATSFHSNGRIPYKYKMSTLSQNIGDNIFVGNNEKPIDSADSIAGRIYDKEATSNITLPLYNLNGKDAKNFHPVVVPGYCNDHWQNKASDGHGMCYRTNDMVNSKGTFNFCTNELDIGDSNIGSLTLDSIHQQNNCGSSSPFPSDVQTAAQAEADSSIIQSDNDNNQQASIANNNIATISDNISTVNTNIPKFKLTSQTNITSIKASIDTANKL